MVMLGVVGAVEVAIEFVLMLVVAVVGDVVAEGGDFSSSLSFMNGLKELMSPAIAKLFAR